MTRDTLYDETRRVAANLNSDLYPEAGIDLQLVLAGVDPVDVNILRVAIDLLECDKPGPLPACLLEYIADLYRLGIAEENADAMNDLGAMYYNGSRGFEQNYEKAVYYYKMAAKNGSRKARENLGYCYYYGRVGEPNYEKAFHCFAPGAFEGRPVSLYKIGDMYLNGYYVDKDEREAFSLYNRCFDISKDDAKIVAGPVHLRLGDMYLKGVGTDWDPEQALFHYNLAEILLYRMVKSGDTMYMQSLRNAVEGQSQARALLMQRLGEG